MRAQSTRCAASLGSPRRPGSRRRLLDLVVDRQAPGRERKKVSHKHDEAALQICSVAIQLSQWCFPSPLSSGRRNGITDCQPRGSQLGGGEGRGGDAQTDQARPDQVVGGSDIVRGRIENFIQSSQRRLNTGTGSVNHPPNQTEPCPQSPPTPSPSPNSHQILVPSSGGAKRATGVERREWGGVSGCLNCGAHGRNGG